MKELVTMVWTGISILPRFFSTSVISEIIYIIFQEGDRVQQTAKWKIDQR